MAEMVIAFVIFAIVFAFVRFADHAAAEELSVGQRVRIIGKGFTGTIVRITGGKVAVQTDQAGVLGSTLKQVRARKVRGL